MTQKHAFEALDRTLRYMFGQNGNMNCERLFGGKVVVFCGDFRQTLPIVQGGTRQDIVNASLYSSYLWGKGKLGGQNDGDATFDIPDDLLIKDTKSMKIQIYLVNEPYSPTNDVVEEVNDRLLSMFSGEEKEYLCSDSINLDENVRDTLQENMYSPDVVKRLYNRVIEVVISGTNIGDHTYISRTNLIPADKKIPFRFQRRQFPIAVCFAMTINKSQSQSLSRVGLFLRQPIFAHD
ncbi:uncharacterized protein LOC143573376 [Bidens hawaiensis]|uniref:uncharacterized protein LOC143573376 n=1 Tax=Bidens hawaiensis TaxID=980011 RepID=UPI00404926C6